MLYGQLRTEIMDYILKRPISHKFKIETALKEGFGIEIPMFFGGRKKAIFKELANAIYFMSTEAMLLDAALALQFYFDKKHELISQETLRIFNGLAQKSVINLGFHTLLVTDFHEVATNSGFTSLMLTNKLYGEYVEQAISSLSTLDPLTTSTNRRYYSHLAKMQGEEAARVYVNAIERVERSFAGFPPNLKQMMMEDLLHSW